MGITAVYQIRNKITGDTYIGSSCDLKQRWKRHKRQLKNGNHHSIYMNRAYLKYGDDCFEYSILEEVCQSKLLEREQYYIDTKKPVYNSCPKAGSSKGVKRADHLKVAARKYAIENNIKPPRSTYEYKMKKVAMLDKVTSKTIREFESMSEGARYLNKGPDFASSIREVCNGKRKSILGYGWKWTI